jgi:hypothetical protein
VNVQRTYPLTPTAPDDRFTYGLLIDIAEQLHKHGYTRPVASLDLVALQQALFGFLYATDHKPPR